MLILKYICAIIAIISTLLYINSVISDIVMPPSLKALELNISEEQVTKNSSAFRFILSIIMGLTWPVLFLF